VLDIARAIDAHPVVIVAGATGSGKSTQLPKIALAMGRGVDGVIGVTQPRRIAATSVATRVAEELGTPLGTDVGYQVRFDDHTSPGTYVKFMTDGILLAEIQGDPLLRRYDTLLIDEAHERSLTIDFLLGYLRDLLPKRPDLKVVVSSATLELQRFSDFFGGAPIIEVEGRTYPVEVLYEPPPEDSDLPEAVAAAVVNVTDLDPHGDILVFLPGEREIRETEGELRGRNLKHTVIEPLYARLTAAEQARVFTSISQRRVVLATNVAETSITIPGIVYVIDSGLARIHRYEARTGTTRLPIEAISQASADQRKGRCGRVREGICIRLYEEQDFEQRSAFTDPEIRRTGLAGVILRMKAQGLGDVETFPFLDPPHPKAITEGYRVLEELGALGPRRELTPLGRQLARFPVDPRLARMILAGEELGCLTEVLVLAAALGLQDPRERPRERQQQADEKHRRFRDERSDFVSLLRLWSHLREASKKGKGELRRVCKDGFLSWVRVREWFEVHQQLERVAKELRLSGNGQATSPKPAARAAGKRAEGKPADEPESQENHDALHRALLAGLLSRIGQWHPEQRVYLGAKQTRFAIHPSSHLAKKPPAWVMATELVETSQLFARSVTKIDPTWLEGAGAHLIKTSVSDPHWAEKPARVTAKQQGTLYGLPVFRDRAIDYATVEPAEARRLFIEHALVRGEYRSPGHFQEKNRALLAEIAVLRDKARKSDMLADDEALFAFFDEKIPAEVVNGKTFEEWHRAATKERGRGAEDPLTLTMADVLVGEPGLAPENYPDTLRLHGSTLKLSYRFDPAEPDDGVTITVPLAFLPQVDPDELAGTVPGWHREKLVSLLYEVPKAFRRDLGDIPTLATVIAARVTPLGKPYAEEIIAAVRAETGVDLPITALRFDEVAPYLRLTLRLVDEDGKVLAAGRDLAELGDRYGAKARRAFQESAAPSPFERKNLRTWDFDELPEHVTRGSARLGLRGYPALQDTGDAVDLVVAESKTVARALTKAGLARLLILASRAEIASVSARLPSSPAALNGAPVTRAADTAFRAALLRRIVEEAFELHDVERQPRTRAEFDKLLAQGRGRLLKLGVVYTEALNAAKAAQVKTLAALKSADRQPSGRGTVLDLRTQLEGLFRDGFIADVPLDRLASYPRYLRAMETRLGRAIADPRKDADKGAPLGPLEKRLATRKRALLAAERPDDTVDLRWKMEELRVAIFAPELKPEGPVSVAKITAALDALGRDPEPRG
jgi:ATP-dependent helicase HrpA